MKNKNKELTKKSRDKIMRREGIDRNKSMVEDYQDVEGEWGLKNFDVIV